MTSRSAAVALAIAGASLAVPSQDFAPARWKRGSVPALPAMVVGGGEVALDVAVTADGRVAGIEPIRTTPPFTERLAREVSRWEFLPALELDPDVRPGQTPSRPVSSSVLVVGVFRPPSIDTPTLGELPRDLGTAPPDVPFPETMMAPPFPPLARSAGIVLLEAAVDVQGAATGTRVLVSAPPFDAAASDALQQWHFRPAHRGGAPVEAFVYVVFGFPLPVASGGSPRASHGFSSNPPNPRRPAANH